MTGTPDFSRIRDSFAKQGFMSTLGVELETIEPGLVTLSAIFQESLTQQHGFFHGGVITSLADVACGYAALSAAPENFEVLTVEFKINFLKPGKAKKLIVVGEVLRAGRTLTVCEATVFNESRDSVIAKMQATMISVRSESE